ESAIGQARIAVMRSYTSQGHRVPRRALPLRPMMQIAASSTSARDRTERACIMANNPSPLPAWASWRAAIGARRPCDVQAGRRPIGARLVALVLRPTTPPLWLGLALAVSLIVVETLVVDLLKRLAPANACGMVYLLGVLVISIGWGFGLAAVTALVSAAAFV